MSAIGLHFRLLRRSKMPCSHTRFGVIKEFMTDDVDEAVRQKRD